MADGTLAAKMYAKFVAGMGRVAGGDTPNWASLPIDQREIWLAIEDLARGALAPSWSLTPGAIFTQPGTTITNKTDRSLAVSWADIDGHIEVMIKPSAADAAVRERELVKARGATVEMIKVLIESLGEYAVPLGEWLDDPDRFEQIAPRATPNLLASITLAYGYLSAMAATAHISIAELIEQHRIEASS